MQRLRQIILISALAVVVTGCALNKQTQVNNNQPLEQSNDQQVNNDLKDIDKELDGLSPDQDYTTTDLDSL